MSKNATTETRLHRLVVRHCINCGGTTEDTNPRQGNRRCYACARGGYEYRMIDACPCGNRAKCEGLDGRENGCDVCCGHAGDGEEACSLSVAD